MPGCGAPAFGLFHRQARDFRQLNRELAGERRGHVQNQKHRRGQILGQARHDAHHGRRAARGCGDYDERKFCAVVCAVMCRVFGSIRARLMRGRLARAEQFCLAQSRGAYHTNFRGHF